MMARRLSHRVVAIGSIPTQQRSLAAHPHYFKFSRAPAQWRDYPHVVVQWRYYRLCNLQRLDYRDSWTFWCRPQCLRRVPYGSDGSELFQRTSAGCGRIRGGGRQMAPRRRAGWGHAFRALLKGLGLPLFGAAESDGAAPIALSCGDRLISLPAAIAGSPPILL